MEQNYNNGMLSHLSVHIEALLQKTTVCVQAY